VGLNVTEQRYCAVLEVEAGIPIAEVAERLGVSRQAVYRWLAGIATRAYTGWPAGQMDDAAEL
jgi:transposase